MRIFEQLERRRQFPEDERMIVDTVRRLAEDVIAPRAAAYDKSGEFPWDNVAAINELGLNTIFLPEAYGGNPVSFRAYLACVQALAEACAATGIIWATNFHALKPVLNFATEDQLSRFAPVIAGGGLASLVITETTAGSDATGMRARFTPDGDDVIVDGSKTFITSGDVADILVVFGKWSEIDDAKGAISAIVIEKGTTGLSVTGVEDKMGHRASSTAGLAFNGCRVPRANLLGEPGQGLAILLSSLNTSRPSVAAHALGIATAAFKDMVAYMNERSQSGQRIIEFQGNQFTLADMATDLAMCEAWLDYVADLIDSGADEFGLEASMAKMRASDLAMRIATEAVQMHGGYGYTRDYRVERLMRDAKVTQIWEGTNQVHRQFIGRSFLIK
jgi:alkylation response protein AidB-like acyl-CoA dehydrogenase